jgi:hypothetical protein
MRTRLHDQPRPRRLATLAAACGLLGAMAVATGPPMPARAAPASLSISVAANHLVDGNGQTVVLRGVNRPGPAYACIQGWGIFDGPSDAASVNAIASWQTNAVRLQLNEDCWLNINGVKSDYGGVNYQNAILNYVNLLHQAGLYAVLSLAFNAPGTTPATSQQVMPDQDHAPAFWQSVATTFQSDHAVLFDLYNEPNGVSWDCWLNGCVTSNGWQAAGFQLLVNTVRATGATQPIALGGLQWANDLSQWLQQKPSDPANALVASFHEYNINSCITLACWTNVLLPVAQRVPVVAGEIGESDCAHVFIDPFMAWADLIGVSYLAFSWEAWPNACANGPTLITAYDGTPTNLGVGVRDHFLTIARGLSLSVAGNGLVDGNSNPVVLRGVNRLGVLYPCIQGWGTFDGPTDATSVAAIATWHANAVRLELNEDCWLGINGVKPGLGGTNYQTAIVNYVNLLHQAGLYAILSLAWSAPGTTPSTDQQVMPDQDHAPAFWQSVATAFRSDRAILFDLYSNPQGVSWDCWLNGCLTPNGWQAVGMQSLVSTVRATGATQPILLGGLQWANDLSQWLQQKPNDPTSALLASFHLYDHSGCAASACWTNSVLPVAQRVPVLTTELGERDCAHGFIDPYMAWADPNRIGYLGFTWEAWANACAAGPTLITAYDGTPTAFGIGLRDHLTAIAR